MILNRRTFSAALVAGVATLTSTRSMAAATTPTKARNVVLVHGLFADGSCWSEVIARLQAAGLNATAVQNPLTTLPEAVASAQRVLARQDGPTVLVDHSRKRMPDQNCRAILACQHPLRGGNRFRQRRQRVLHGSGVEPRSLQSCNHLGPA